ncbi:hypothetical protein [Paramaledivibacter caminithermalis]|jgi:hypothetical protein|uniref:Uncharacterized protein n=1 Tax=Paramaledivibacter caminithermalis (strain DSM 15212 / CIP 107654 / DViRD3) TaxID=1121301 RepID=A0A1M6JQ01_PARC5|nr:hypothetical protein [Paramaledivibacter caminithermalis]SHJ48683.1 hypothetical protein SAMN02745912_00086 [Paramaledivibacter caminithermalis DSM 15212]
MNNKNVIEVCKEHKLQNTQNVLYWINYDYLFYYSCENCTKPNKCKKTK